MKLLIIFDKNIEISPEKICVHTGHSSRHITYELMDDYNNIDYKKWKENNFKTVLLGDKITDKINNFMKDTVFYNYQIYDAGLDGVFEPGTILGYAILIPKDNETFKKLRTLKI